jgi:catechol 2,3-dioxygenase-like lactoylglutathione lyase family enzyme
MSIRIIDHVNIVSERLEETRRFFNQILGLEPGPRPAFAVTGYWLYAGLRAVVHIQAAKGPVGPSVDSALNHFAFEVSDFDAVIARLARHAVAHQVFTVPGTSVRQAFFLDPNGVRIEITEPTDGVAAALADQTISRPA